MRRFKYLDPPTPRYPDGEVRVFKEEDIRMLYYPYWSEKMKKAGKEDLISFENCLEDWMVVNWAEEIKDE